MLNENNKKTLLTLFIVVLVEWIAYGIFLPCLPFYAKSFDASAVQLGMLTSSFALAAMFSSPIIGHLGDRYSKKILVVVCLGISIASMVIAAEAQSYIWLLISRALAGFAAGNIGLINSIVSTSIPAEKRAGGIALVSSGMALGFVLGPVLGGLITGQSIGLTSLQTPFYVAALLQCMSLVLVLLLGHYPSVQTVSNQLQQSVFHSLKNTKAWALLWVSGGVAFVFASNITFFPIWAHEYLRWGPLENGYAFAMVALIIAFVQAYIVRKLELQLSHRVIAMIALLALLASSLIFILTQTLYGAVIGLGVFALGFGLASPVLSAFMSLISPSNRQGTALGILEMIKNAGEFIGPLTVGWLVVRDGNISIFPTTSVVMLLCIGVLHFRRTHLKKITKNYGT